MITNNNVDRLVAAFVDAKDEQKRTKDFADTVAEDLANAVIAAEMEPDADGVWRIPFDGGTVEVKRGKTRVAVKARKGGDA